MKILLVEDSAVDARIAKQRMGRFADADVVVATTLADAEARALEADVVLADLGLPDCEPAETIDRLVATGHPRLVFFSSDPVFTKRAQAAGAQVVSKDDDDDAWAQALA